MNKVLGIVLGVLVLTAGNVFAHCGTCGVGDAKGSAQGHHHGNFTDKTVDEKLKKMTKQLKLTDDQKSKVEAIMKAKMEKKQQIMDDKMKAMEALHEEFKAKLKGILSEEQMKQWENNKGDMMGNAGNMMGDKGKHCPLCQKGKPCDECLKKKGKK